MAGIQLTQQQRSLLMQEILAQRNRPQPNPQTGLEAALRLGATAIQQRTLDKLQAQEAERDSNLSRALTGAPVADAGSVVGLDSVEGPGEQINIPARRGVNLDAEQRLILEDVQRQRAAPSEFDLIAARGEQERQTQAENIQARAAEAEKNRIQRDTEQIRDIQAKAELTRLEEDIKNKAGNAGVKLTERQGKASSWVNQFSVGNQIIEQQLEAGYRPSLKDVAIYGKSIDEETGAVNRRILREGGMSQEAVNFFDAAYLVIDPTVRQATGAAVREFEFINWMNTLIPFSEDPTEIAQKSFIRSRIMQGMISEAGPGINFVQDIEATNPVPQFGSEEKSDIDKAIDQVDRELADLDGNP